MIPPSLLLPLQVRVQCSLFPQDLCFLSYFTHFRLSALLAKYQTPCMTARLTLPHVLRYQTHFTRRITAT